MYEQLGAREQVSAVVPGSARRLAADSEGFVVFSMVVLRKLVSEVSAACRDHRFTLRMFDPAEERGAAEELDEEIRVAQLEAEEKKIKVGAAAARDVGGCAAVVPAELRGAGGRVGASEGAARVRGEHSALRAAHVDVQLRGVRRRGAGA